MKQTLEQFTVRIDAHGGEVEKPEPYTDGRSNSDINARQEEYEQATEVIKLPKLVDFAKNLYVKANIDVIVQGYAEGYLNAANEYVDFLETNLSLGLFIPVDKEGKPMENPESFDDFILMTHDEFSRKYYIDNYINCEKYQTALDNVIFEGWELSYYDRNKTYHLIDNKGGCILVDHNGRKCFEIKGKPIKTINDALNADVPLYVKPENIEQLIK